MDRSEQALRDRLELTRKATDGPWKSDEVLFRKKNFEPSYVVKDGDGRTIVDILPVAAYQETARHIAASSPDVVRADLEEILALRAEVARLKDEIASLEQELKFSDETEYELIKKLFDLKICHKEVICEQADAHELNFVGESGCLFCWRQWAIMKARKAEIEDE